MRFKEPKNTERFYWTEHVKEKMKFYNLSEGRLKRILRNPGRIEKGVAFSTVAAMQSTRSKRPSEIWIMYRKLKSHERKKTKKRKKERIMIISAWRYPGKSPVGQLPLPEDIAQNIGDIIRNSELKIDKTKK